MTEAKKRGGRARGYFPKVREARQALADHAVEIYQAYMNLAVAAQKAEDFTVAEKILWNLLDHMPEDEESGTLLGTSVDKTKEIEKGSSGPSIQIGLALGGMPPQAALPPAPEVIELHRGPEKGTPRNTTIK